jgi:hypothetical protein
MIYFVKKRAFDYSKKLHVNRQASLINPHCFIRFIKSVTGMLHGMFNRTTSVFSNGRACILNASAFSSLIRARGLSGSYFRGKPYFGEIRACYYNVIIAGFGADCFRVKIRSFNLGCGKPESS